MKNKHPLANAQQARLDIIYGGSEEEILNECFRIMKDSMSTLELEENVMMINSLVGKNRFEPRFNKLLEKYPDQIRGATYYGKLLIDRLEFLRFIIPHLKIRLVVLNSFELAVFNSRHRMQLLELIKWMRDDMNMHLVICMQNPPANYGSQGSLKLMASSIERVGGHMASLKDKAVGVLPAEMDNVGWPYNNEPIRTVFEEPEETVAARERGLAARKLEAERFVKEAHEPRAAYDEASVLDYNLSDDDLEREEREQAEMIRQMRERLHEARNEVPHEARSNGFTEQEEAYAEQCIDERNPGPNYSPFSKGYDLENA